MAKSKSTSSSKTKAPTAKAATKGPASKKQPAAKPAAPPPPAVLDELSEEELEQGEIVQPAGEELAAAPSEVTAAAAEKPAKVRSYATAEQMARSQRSISVSEFFAKNRHLLGFDNPRKALLTTVKEAVDNSLDACEEGGILPAVEIRIDQLAETHYRVRVTDNGPGIVKKEIPNVFGKLLYGSKFHRLRMSRGQQGIGISAAGMYGLLTTGHPVKITSRTSGKQKAHYYELQIDTKNNRPDIIKEEQVDWDRPHGTSVEIELEARYQQGRQSVDDYLLQTAIANPHVTLTYQAPDGRVENYPASVPVMPPTPREVKPHPHGVELGVMIKMLAESKARTLRQFFTQEFSRVSPRVAAEILEKAGLKDHRPSHMSGQDARAIYQAIQQVKLLAPATDCVVPIGEEKLVSGLRQVVSAGFYAATTRRPAVYRGNPFIIETALAYGKPEAPDEAATAAADAQQAAEDSGKELQPPPAAPTTDEEEEANELAKLIRFANRVPLLYQQSACAIYKSVASMNWRQYGLTQTRGALPIGPLTIVIHMASVWVPFTSESKEAIASYPEILREIRLALQDCARKLGAHIRAGIRMKTELKKRSYIEKYIPAIGEALRDILELPEKQVDKVCADLKVVLERSRKM